MKPIPAIGRNSNMNFEKLAPACSNVFAEDIYGDHVVSCAGIVGINIGITLCAIPLLTFVFGAGFQLEKKLILGLEVDIEICKGLDKPLRPADVALLMDIGHDVCVDLTWSSPLTQTGMVDFVAGHAVIKDAQRKHVKYETKCADIGYDFLPFSLSSFGKLEKDAITLLKRIRKFSVTQGIGARIHIFSRIDFIIARGMEPHILPFEDIR
ncbi:hypothetical protein Tco_0257379 [Tanacetum coccineum]